MRQFYNMEFMVSNCSKGVEWQFKKDRVNAGHAITFALKIEQTNVAGTVSFVFHCGKTRAAGILINKYFKKTILRILVAHS